MMSDENNRDIYITIASMPPPKPCSFCCPVPSATTIRTGKHTLDGLRNCSPCLRLTRLTSSFFFRHREWAVSRARLCTQQQVPGGVPVPHFPASLPTEEGSGHPIEH